MRGQGAICQGFFVGYALERRWLTLTPRLGYCRGGFENDTLRAAINQVDASLRLSHTWDFPWFSVDLGVSVFALSRPVETVQNTMVVRFASRTFWVNNSGGGFRVGRSGLEVSSLLLVYAG